MESQAQPYRLACGWRFPGYKHPSHPLTHLILEPVKGHRGRNDCVRFMDEEILREEEQLVKPAPEGGSWQRESPHKERGCKSSDVKPCFCLGTV